MPNLNQQIKDWTNQGLISPDQATKILQYEATKPRSSWVLYGLLILGVLVIGLGSVLLIWGNWSQISDAGKLLGVFSILAGITTFAYYAREVMPKWVYDALIMGLQVFALLTIAVIADVYRSGGDVTHALLFWGLILFPAVLTTEYMVVPLMWVSILLMAILGKLDGLKQFGDLFNIFDRLVFALPPYLAVMFSLLGEMRQVSKGMKKALKCCLITSLLVGICSVELLRVTRNIRIEQVAFQSAVIGVLALASLGIFYISGQYSKIQKNILMSLTVLYSLSIYVPYWTGGSGASIAAVTILELGLLGGFFAAAKSRMLFNLILILASIRFFLIFIETFGSRAMTGAGLVASGALLITLAIMWHKHRNQLAAWMERRLQ
jgi:hypothetical protein